MRWLSVISATLVALVALLNTVAGPTASADLVYVSDEIRPSSHSKKVFLDLSQSVDGIDPVSHHRLMQFPDQGHSLILWQGQGEPLVWAKDYGLIDQVDRFEMIMDAKLPAGSDVLYQVWSIGEQTLVEDFVHTRTQAPWAIDTVRINELPRGHYVINALVRTREASGEINILAEYDQGLQVVAQDGLVLPPPAPRDPSAGQRPDRGEDEDGEGAMPAPPLGPVTAGVARAALRLGARRRDR